MILCSRVRYVGKVKVYCPNVNCVNKVAALAAQYQPPQYWQVFRKV